MKILNDLIMLGILMLIAFALKSYFVWLKKNGEGSLPKNILQLDILTNGVKGTIESILAQRPEELNLSEYEMEKRIENKKRLRKSIRQAPLGDLGAKLYVKDYISNLLQAKYHIKESSIESAIPFGEKEALNVQEKFSILLELYKKEYGLAAITKMFEENGWDQLRKDGRYGVYEEDIQVLFEYKGIIPEFVDKLEVLVQIIYQRIYGNGVVDELRDMEIEGLSGGVSGIPESSLDYMGNLRVFEKSKVHYSYDSIHILLNGKTIPLYFLSFGSEKELIRVSKNIHRFNNPGHLSEEKAYIENDMRDGSRVTVVRPPFSDSWAFWIRKHQSGRQMRMEDLIIHKNKEYPLKVMEYLMKGCQTTIFTGGMYSGKTTLLRSSIEFINSNYNLRIQESVFELWMRKVYPTRNIAAFRELPSINGERVLEIQKRTDGTVHLLGELLREEAARWIVSVGQSGSKFTLCTHHAKKTVNLLDWMLNAFLNHSGMKNEMLAMRQIVDAINFDVHCGLNELTGERFIERITEIVPVPDERIYETIDIVVFDREKREYRLCNSISIRALEEISQYLSKEEYEELKQFFHSGKEPVREVEDD